MASTGHQSKLPEQMSHPRFYPHEVMGEIRHIQTHISHVFLTGKYAYKIKKPYNLGFLDFSTLKKRKYFCEEELRLNKIFSPDIYLSVVRIYEKNGEYNFYSGKIIDYAVKMREFDQSDILSERVKNGNYDQGLFEKLSAKIAELHASSKTNEEISAFGSPEAVQKIARDNFDQTSAFIDQSIERENYNQIKTFTLNFIKDNKETFKQRQKNGKIKECHGDLHLRNICIYNNEIQLFDRIEFNKEFKNIDTVYDLAFLIMDLYYRNHADLAVIVMNEYFERNGDYSGVELLRFYCSIRAYIRGKVISFQLNDKEIEGGEKEKAKEQAARYFNLSKEFTSSGKPALIIMNGLSGSGKSTIARQISQEKKYFIIRSDALRKHLAGVPLYKKAAGDIYTPEMSEKTYREMTDKGISIAKKGLPVILDAKFDKKQFREYAIKKAEKEGIEVRIVHCKAQKETLKKRLGKRGKDVSDATKELIDGQYEKAEWFSEEEKKLVVTIDTESLSKNELVEKIQSTL